MADTAEVDKALINYLSADAALMALLPGGVWWDLADVPSHYVLVSEVDHDDQFAMPGRTVSENFLYLIKAVTQGSSGSSVKAGAARIFDLLNNATLTAAGYHPSMVVRRVRRIRYTELDEDTNTRWQHRGGHYEVRLTPR